MRPRCAYVSVSVRVSLKSDDMFNVAIKRENWRDSATEAEWMEMDTARETDAVLLQR